MTTYKFVEMEAVLKQVAEENYFDNDQLNILLKDLQKKCQEFNDCSKVAEIHLSSIIKHDYIYDKMASRLLVDKLRKSIPNTFSGAMENIQSLYYGDLDEDEAVKDYMIENNINVFSITDSKYPNKFYQFYVNKKNHQNSNLDIQDVWGKYILSKSFFNKEYNFLEYVKKHADELNSFIDLSRDNLLGYFGLKTLMNSYLIKYEKTICESPQYMYLRVATYVCMNMDNHRQRVKDIYDIISKHEATFATPTMFNAGLQRSQCASCFVLHVDDTMKSFSKIIGDIALISSSCGGLGIDVTNIRSQESFIKGGGLAAGPVKFIQMVAQTLELANQGGKRNGSVCIYFQLWVLDTIKMIHIGTNTGDNSQKAFTVFIALWIPDLFMKRVLNDEMWTLFCPNDCPGLADTYGDEFEKLYTMYEDMDKERPDNKKKGKRIRAQELYGIIIATQIETGQPFMLYKDNVNNKSNQKNIGIIRSSNLCTEITEYTNCNEMENILGVCNLASISLPKFVNTETRTFDYDRLRATVKKIVPVMNNIIDINSYPIHDAKTSNLMSRPIGIGWNGLADVGMLLKLPYTSPEMREVNRLIAEHMYYAALEASMEEAIKFGPYDYFKGSPASEGILQFDMWKSPIKLTLDWNSLKDKIKKHGLRNSLLIALMPTASTSHIMGNYECFEPIFANIMKRKTFAGNFQVVNKYLIDDLKRLNLWSESILKKIVANLGSIQNIEEIPNDIKEIYKIIWEIPISDQLEMSADRGHFVCQSQSLNIRIENTNLTKSLARLHVQAWQLGLKTGMYYFNSRSPLTASQSTLNNAVPKQAQTCSRKKNDDGEICVVCSS